MQPLFRSLLYSVPGAGRAPQGSVYSDCLQMLQWWFLGESDNELDRSFLLHDWLGWAPSPTLPRMPLALVAEVTDILGLVADIFTHAGRTMLHVWATTLFQVWLPSMSAEDGKAATRETLEGLVIGMSRIATVLTRDQDRQHLLPALPEFLTLVAQKCCLDLVEAALRSESIFKRREGLILLGEVWAWATGWEEHPSGAEPLPGQLVPEGAVPPAGPGARFRLVPPLRPLAPCSGHHGEGRRGKERRPSCGTCSSRATMRSSCAWRAPSFASSRARRARKAA